MSDKEVSEFNKAWEAANPRKELPEGEYLDVGLNEVYKVEISRVTPKPSTFKDGDIYKIYGLGEKSPTNPNGFFKLGGTSMMRMDDWLEANWEDKTKPCKVMFLMEERENKAGTYRYKFLKAMPGNW